MTDVEAGARTTEVCASLSRIHLDMVATERAAAEVIGQLHPTHRSSGANLIHYLTLRRQDLRPLQHQLADLGLSSLGRCEAHVIGTVERVLGVLACLVGDGHTCPDAGAAFAAGPELLRRHASELLGPAPKGGPTRIMVTMPSEAAEDYELVRGFVISGMDCARINCAHDDPHAWAQMAGHIRRAATEAGRYCPIVMDLPGPKLRTGPIEPGPAVLKVKPRRDELGRVVEPATVWLTTPGSPVPAPAPDSVTIPVTDGWVATLHAGDRIRLRDARGSRRVWTVAEVVEGVASVRVTNTTYVTPGTLLRAPGDRRSAVGQLPRPERALVVRPGDTITLITDPAAVSSDSETFDDGSAGLRIGCTLPAALAHVRVGQRVWFDDGRIGGTIAGVRSGEADVTVTVASPSGSKLRTGKGINFPETDLHLPALGADDQAALPFVIDLADVVSLSFVQRPADINDLRQTLRALGASNLGIILKIETAEGFNRLPDLLLAAMQSERVGVMIARGDLAVECGFERLAEVQEEILWLCEAARLPVIWATQVLDQLARTGQPSRAEITDAAMSERAECVMLNKGPHMTEAISALDNIIHRMGGHHDKKAPLLRRLKAWDPKAG